MPRLPNLTDRATVPPNLREAFDLVAAQRNGAVSGPYGILLHSPEVALRGASLGNYVRFHSDLTPQQREVAVVALGHELGAAVIWASHTRLARAAGVSDEVIAAIAENRPATALPGDAGLIVRYVRELFREHRVSDEAFAALHGRLGDRGIVDLTGLLGYYAFVGTVLNAFEVEP